jgi:WD40 repeat protein
MRRGIRAPLVGFVGLLPLLTVGPAAVPAPRPTEARWQAPAPALPDITPLPASATARLGRAAHALRVHAFSPDGKLLAVSDWKHLYLWDARTGRCRGVMEGRYIGSRSRTVADGRTLYAMPGICAAAFSPDGAILATGGDIPCLCFWNTATGKQIGKTRYDKGGIHYLRFTPDGNQVLVGGYEAQFWDVATQRVVRTFTTPGRKDRSVNVWAAALSPDGKKVAAANDTALWIWSADGKLLHKIPQDSRAHPRRMTFSADSRTLIVNPSAGERLRRWDVATGKPLGGEAEDETPRTARLARFSADGRFLVWTIDDISGGYASGYGRTLFVADTARERELLRRDVQPPASFVLSADGKTLAVAEYDGGMYLLDMKTGKRTLTCVEAPRPVVGLCYRDHGKRLLSLTDDGMVHDWDTKKAVERRRLAVPLPAKTLPHRLAPDCKRVALVDAQGGVRVWDLETGRERWREPRALSQPFDKEGLPPQPRILLEFAPDGQTLVGICGDRGTRWTTWDTASGGKQHRWGRWSFQAVALSPDGRRLFAGIAEQLCAVGVWELASGKEVERVTLALAPARDGGRLRKTEVTDILSSPDGRAVAVIEGVVIRTFPNRGGFNGIRINERRVHIWERAAGRRPRLLAAPVGRALAFSPDSKLLAWVEGGYGLAILNRTRGSIHKTRGLGQADVTTLRFAPDGKTLAAGSVDGTILLWDVEKVLREPPTP